MGQRQQPTYRRRETRAQRPGAGSRTRFPILALMVGAVVVGVLSFSANALFARVGEAGAQGERQENRAAAVAPDTGNTRSSDSEREAPARHVTFGAHTTATQACVTCHPDTPTGEIACRSCHANTCGKDSKTVADCLVCHRTGTTDRWVVDEP